MSQPRCDDMASIDFLIASSRTAICCEASRSQTTDRLQASQDSISPLLLRLGPNPEVLYLEVEPSVDKHHGVRVVDDSTLDKFHARNIEPAHRRWSSGVSSTPGLLPAFEEPIPPEGPT
jgi:hypothetical protein